MIFRNVLETDANLLRGIQEIFVHEEITPLFQLITTIGNYGAVWILFSIFYFVGSKNRRIGLLALGALALSFLISNLLLKNMVDRIRPYDVEQGIQLLIDRQLDSSFPSGHTSSSFASATVFYSLSSGKWRGCYLVLAGLIGFSRMYLGVHYPSDVLSGLIIGVICGLSMVKLDKRAACKKKN